LVLVITLDLLLGLWLKLHYPDGLPWFFLVNTPTIGLAAFIWGLLPKPQQEAVSEQLGAAMESRAVQRTMFAAIVTLGAGSLFVAGLNVTLLDSGTSTTLHLVRGTQAEADARAMQGATSFVLDRLSTPHHLVRPITPLGERVWLYSPTHVLQRDVRLLPWWPVDLVYPTDFATQARVAVVPDQSVLDPLSRPRGTLVLRLGDTRAELVRLALSDSTIIVSLIDPGRVGQDDLDRWTVWLDSLPHDTTSAAMRRFHDEMVRHWRVYRWVRPARPLRQGDTLTWELRSAADSLLQERRLPLDAATVDLHLTF
jgi:hypothetical protein